MCVCLQSVFLPGGSSKSRAKTPAPSAATTKANASSPNAFATNAFGARAVPYSSAPRATAISITLSENKYALIAAGG